MESLRGLNNARDGIWVGIMLYTILLMVFLFYAPMASDYTHTFLVPNSAPGTLTTDWWSRDFWFTGSLVVLWLVPITAAFMSDSPTTASRRTFHVVVVVLVWIYAFVAMVLWSFDYGNANAGVAGNLGNKANDDRWCCVYYNVPGSGCPNTVGCNPGVGPEMLVVNPVFLWKFWWTITFLFILIVDFMYVLLPYKGAVREYLEEYRRRRQKPVTNAKGRDTPAQKDADPAAYEPPPPPRYRGPEPQTRAAPAAARIQQQQVRK